MDWKGKAVLVTGGASLIGSHLVDERWARMRPGMPTGSLNRVAYNTLPRKLLGQELQVKFMDGVQWTIDWYFATEHPKP